MDQKYIEILLKKTEHINKADLFDFIINYTDKVSKDDYKDDIVFCTNNYLKKDNKMRLDFIKSFPKKTGLTSKQVREIINCSDKERKRWQKEERLIVVDYYKVRAYGKDLYCPLFSFNQIINLAEEEINKWRTEYKPPSQKQLKALEKARKKNLKNRTCKNCNQILGSKHQLINGLCEMCLRIEETKKMKKLAIKERKRWLENKDKYVIVDTETTGLDYYDDDIIEIAIIDLDGNVLLHTFVNTDKEISEEAQRIHGITSDMIKDYPYWKAIADQVKNILKGKIILAYNASFDIEMINSMNYKYSQDDFYISDYQCLMENQSKYYNLDYYLKLHENEDEIHSALDDCLLCLDIVKKLD